MLVSGLPVGLISCQRRLTKMKLLEKIDNKTVTKLRYHGRQLSEKATFSLVRRVKLRKLLIG